MKDFLESKDLLQTVVAETDKVNDEAQQLVRGLSEEQLNWKPSPDRWSIAQCLDHLSVSGKGFEPYFAALIDRGHSKWPVTSAVKYQPTFMGRLLIKQLLPETTRKLRAPKIFRPSESSAIYGAPGRFFDQQKSFLRFVSSAKGIDYNKARLRSPVTPLIRYSLADAFVVIVVHNYRHLAQARRVRETPGFPAA
jgi:hypothetical protein